jgi:hypothetical protein
MIYRAGEYGLSARAIQQRLGINFIHRTLRQLEAEGSIERFGSGRSTMYRRARG